jgi:cell division septal protein FtsQ
MQQRYRPRREAKPRNRFDVGKTYAKNLRDGPRISLPPVNRAVVMAVLVCILLAALTIWFLGDEFHIKDVQVQNNQGVPAAQIIATSGLLGEHWWFADLNAAAKRVGELPGVQSSRITCVWQSGCVVLIQPAPALADWQNVDGSPEVWVDQEGKVQRALNDVPATLAIRQEDGESPALGTPLDDKVLRALKELVALQPGVTRYTYSAQYGLVFTDSRGWKVRLGVANYDGEISRKLQVLRQISDQLAAKNQTARVFDVRYVDAPFYVK